MAARVLGTWVLGAVLTFGSAFAAEEAPAKPVTVTLKDGGTLVGTIVAEDGSSVTLRTASGVELKLPAEAIASRVEAPEKGEVMPGVPAAGEPAATPSASRLSDPNESRLMFAPTGRPLGKGQRLLLRPLRPLPRLRGRPDGQPEPRRRRLRDSGVGSLGADLLRVGVLGLFSSGDFGPVPLTAIAVDTGRVVWRDRSFARLNMVKLGSRVLVLDEEGSLGS